MFLEREAGSMETEMGVRRDGDTLQTQAQI